MLEGFPTRGSFIPECSPSGKSCSISSLLGFQGREKRSVPLTRFSGKACSKLVLTAEFCGDTVLQGFRTWWEQFLPPACWKPALLCRSGRSQNHEVSVCRSFSAGGCGEGVCDFITKLDLRQNVGMGYACERMIPTRGEVQTGLCA